jgi:hypothetical protein
VAAPWAITGWENAETKAIIKNNTAIGMLQSPKSVLWPTFVGPGFPYPGGLKRKKFENNPMQSS